MNIGERFTADAVRFAREAIDDAEGREVFFVASFGEEEKIEGLEVAARGDDGSVPALEPFLERGDAVVHNHPSGMLKPSGPDLRIASDLGNRGIGFYIIDNRARRVYCVAEPARKKRREALDQEMLCSLMLPGGALSSIFPDYESRDSQVAMTERIINAFNQDKIMVCEAGTGVGKSLAYLIPAAAWAILNGERVVVSTATINLQQQLIEKDIPLVRRLLKGELKSVLVKGRGNYLCFRRLEEALEENSLFREEDSDLEAIRQWALSSESGSRSDLPFYPKKETWSAVCSETDACMGLKCRYREHCFVLKARREAAGANLLVVNHHLLFSDLALRLDGAGFEGGAVLPAFGRLVFDEAHTIERSATSFFSSSFQVPALYKQLGRLRRQQGRRSFGALVSLRKLSTKPESFDPIAPVIANIRLYSEELNALGLSVLSSNYSLRFTALEEEHRKALLEAMARLRSGLVELISLISKALESVETEDDDTDLFEAKSILDRLSSASSIFASYAAYEDRDESVFWMELRGPRDKRFVSFIETPLDIGPTMRDAVYEPFESIVFTSATLSVQGKFGFWMSRIGLYDKEERLETGIFPSPFRYREQVLLALPDDPPEPSSPEYQNYVSSFVRQAVLSSGGGALVLFTSYGMLNKTWDAVADEIKAAGYPMLRQGQDDRAKLLKRFVGEVSSVLFATDSFWEGVDAPGQALRLVIICRLPFRVPTDPVLQARTEAIAAAGGKPFFQLSLPEAAMRLKQGFGRLMRKAEDRGIVAILDPRIIRKSYGRVLLQSLPKTKLVKESSRRIIEEMEDFLYQ